MDFFRQRYTNYCIYYKWKVIKILYHMSFCKRLKFLIIRAYSLFFKVFDCLFRKKMHKIIVCLKKK